LLIADGDSDGHRWKKQCWKERKKCPRWKKIESSLEEAIIIAGRSDTHRRKSLIVLF
jgi:hypothetical protein